jgi:hypothetical protein
MKLESLTGIITALGLAAACSRGGPGHGAGMLPGGHRRCSCLWRGHEYRL